MQPPDILASAMSLRDYFAAKAMAPLVAINATANDDDKMLEQDIAECAYFIADAMLVARGHPPSAWPDIRTDTDFLKG